MAPSRAARPVVLPVDAADASSLTQKNARSGRSCDTCGDVRLTEITMTLTDGTLVEFVSCHHCETKSWRAVATGDAMQLGFDSVLEHTRKIR